LRWRGLETGSRRTYTGTKLETADTAKGSLRGTAPVLDPTTLLAAVAYYGAFSRDLPGQTAETVLEVTYTLVLTPWLTVQPDIQYVIHPGGRSTVRNALVIGAQISITF
jgi:Carbohydrate-selective porin, OprB family